MEAGGIGPIGVFPDPDALADAVAAATGQAMREAVAARGLAFLALAGGSTPEAAYRRLAAQPDAAPWDRVEFLFGDERCVPPDHPASNYRMAREALLDPLGIAPGRVHRMAGELDPDAAARAYERAMRALLGDGGPDLVLLGLGGDGHTASLFPGTPALQETTRWVVPGEAPVEPRRRITLTLPALAAARQVWFLVSGAGKAAAMGEIASGRDLPAARVRAGEGLPCWWLDRDAAARLPEGPPGPG